MVASVHVLDPLPNEAVAQRSGDFRALLLRELQHRTANLLHVVSLQLEVQARRASDLPSRVALQSITRGFQGLVQAQKGFDLADFDVVGDAAVEVRSAAEALAAGYAQLRPGIRFSCIARAEERLTVRPAGVLSLIVNELMANAYKHAFRTRDSGHLIVSLASIGAGRACLMVVDDGPGFDLADHTGRAGLRIVRSLAKAIGGELSASGGSGAECRVKVTFPLVPAAAT